MDTTSNNILVISCSPGLNIALSHELEEMGYTIIKSDPKAVIINGDLTDTMKLNYQLRCANRVLWQIAGFRAIHPNHLYKNARKIPWENYLDVDGYFSIDSFAKK